MVTKPFSTMEQGQGNLADPKQGQSDQLEQAKRPSAETEAHFDSAGLEARTGGDSELIDMIVDTFLGDAPNRINDLRAAVEDSDHDEIQLLAHSLKGVAGVAGAVRLERLSRKMETAAQQKKFADLATLIDRIDSEFKKLTLVMPCPYQKPRTD